jgi:hypothetical protein
MSADTANENSTPWWQWWGGTIANSLNSAIESNNTRKAAEAMAQAKAEQDAKNATLSFLGLQLSKQTLLWIGGGVLIGSVLLIALGRRR